MKYKPTRKSIKQHETPDWFHDAKLGVMSAWGIYSIPAFAPIGKTSNDLIYEEGWNEYYKRTPYGEWYENSIKIEDSPARRHHEKTWGADFKYADFLPVFKEHIQNWSPKPWIEMMKTVGARYIIVFTKFHDGFLMWPSRYRHPFKSGWYSERDVIKEVADECRANGLRFGAYYSGTVDWSFIKEPIRDLVDLMVNSGPGTKKYGEYVDNH